MIESEKLALARTLFHLKQGNTHAYQAICKGLQDLADPEHRRFVAASPDNLQRAQGRVQMITEVLEVFFRCEEIVTPQPRAMPPDPSRFSLSTKGQVNNGTS